MKITSLEIKNFRNLHDISISLHPELTVFTALNGNGKTAILDAVRASLWAYVRKIDVAGGSSGTNAVGINIDDVTLVESHSIPNQMEPKVPSSIKVKGSAKRLHPLNGSIDEQLSWEIFREKVAKKTKTLYSKAKQVEKLAEYYQKRSRVVQPASNLSTNKKIEVGFDEDTTVFESKPQCLPVFGFYGTGRLWNVKKQSQSTLKLDNSFYSRTFGYLDCLDEASSYRYFATWFQWLFESHRDEQIKALEAGSASTETHFSPYIKAIQNAVAAVIEKETEWTKLEYSKASQSIVLTHPQKGILKLSQLSDGVRNAVALTADIAYRCIKLNGHLKELATIESEGIILIDEIDMHLHPSWQQQIVRQLKAAFPRLQFIMTTHSPQVISTIDSECVRVLKDGEVFDIPKGTKGAESSRVLERVFLVSDRPVHDENARLLAKYTELVYQDKWGDAEAIALREQLNVEFSGEEPALVELDLYIENRTWELELEEDQ